MFHLDNSLPAYFLFCKFLFFQMTLHVLVEDETPYLVEKVIACLQIKSFFAFLFCHFDMNIVYQETKKEFECTYQTDREQIENRVNVLKVVDLFDEELFLLYFCILVKINSNVCDIFLKFLMKWSDIAVIDIFIDRSGVIIIFSELFVESRKGKFSLLWPLF